VHTGDGFIVVKERNFFQVFACVVFIFIDELWQQQQQQQY